LPQYEYFKEFLLLNTVALKVVTLLGKLICEMLVEAAPTAKAEIPMLVREFP
jgi:hypothetical protein